MVVVNCDDKEWIRRRQMRIMQVRKQSNDIAKKLRERVLNEEQQKRLEDKNLLEAKLHIWKVKRLKNLEEMYWKAISDFGTGHKTAAENPNPVKKVKEKHKEYLCKAKERGETALEQELKEKKEAAEKKQMPIQRKMITRKIEDLRSSLICSIPAKEPSVILRDIYAGKTFDPKLFENCESKEHTKKILRQEETVEKNGSQPVKRSSEGFACRKTGTGKMKSKKKIVNYVLPKSAVKSDIHKEKTSKIQSPRCEKNWVNLGALERLTEEEDETKNEEVSRADLKETKSQKRMKTGKTSRGKEKVLKSSLLTKKGTPIKQKAVIECHGLSLRHNCKLKDSIYVVQSPRNTLEPNAVELALKEEEKLLLEKNEKETRESAAEERGNKALEKEKIMKNYNDLLMKLGKLSTKEKLIKSTCHIPPAYLFFSDERRKEKSARKQRIMDSEFERIYYDVTGEKPSMHSNTGLILGPSIEEVKADSESGSVITKLDFSKLDSNLKTNSPVSCSESNSQRKEESNHVSSVEKVLIEKTPLFHFKGTKRFEGDNKALLEIDRILKKCQELRQESRTNADLLPSETGPEYFEKKADLNLDNESISFKSTENESIELQFCKSDNSSQCEEHRLSDIKDLKSSPRKNVSAQDKAVLEDLAMGDVPRNIFGIRNNVTVWPVHEISRTNPGKRSSGRSSSTSYRSLPSEMQPRGINSLLELLAILKEREGKCAVADELISDIEETLASLVRKAEKDKSDLNEEDHQDFENNPRLNYYISKLLDMSRETVAELSLSSESDTSIHRKPALSDKPDLTVQHSENKYLKQINDNSRISRITRAKELEEIIKKWKSVLEQSLKSCFLEDDFSDSEEFENAAECVVEEEKKDEEKYEDIAKICSERMAVLSNVLVNCMNKGYLAKPDEEYGETHGIRVEDLQEPAKEEQNYIARPENEIPKQFSFPKKESKEPPGSKSPRKKKLEYCDDRCCPFRKSLKDGNNVKCQKTGALHSADNSSESLPNVMEELLKKKIITSPFQWSQGNALNEHSRKSKCGSVHEGIKYYSQVNKLPDKNEEECPKVKVNNCLYQPYKCKDSCKGSCSTGANKLVQEVKQTGKSRRVTEKVNQGKKPHCVAECPTKVIKRPLKDVRRISYYDPAYGLFSPVPRSSNPRPQNQPKKSAPEFYAIHPDDLFMKKSLNSRFIWDPETKNFTVNSNEGVLPVPTHRPFWEPRDEIPKSPGIKFTAVRKNLQGSLTRPKSSPVRGYETDSGREYFAESFADPRKILNFDHERMNFCLNDLDVDESENEIMSEWIRRNMVSKFYDQNSGSRDSCAGSCAVHCNNDYNAFNSIRRSSYPGGSYKKENYQRAANSSPDVREYRRAPVADFEFYPIRYDSGEEYGEYEGVEDCTKFDDLKWSQDLFQNLNDRSRL